jgi:hypothetical protein
MASMKSYIIRLILAILLISYPKSILAAMSSTNFQIQWDEVSGAGGESSSSSYQLRDSISDSAAARSSSANYRIDQGYRAGTYDRVSNFVPYIQDRSTQTAATAFVSNVVTVTTASDFAVDDWVILIQDEGQSQSVGMGKVTEITANTLTLTSPLAGGTPAIDGSGDYLYKMSTTGSIDFGTLTPSAISARILGWVADADVEDGYSVYAFDDGDLRTGSSDTIADVTDGTVSAGASEYGARSSDTSLASSTFDTQDSALTIAPQQVASVAANPFESAGFLTLKVAISSAQTNGSYAQTLSVVFVGDY